MSGRAPLRFRLVVFVSLALFAAGHLAGLLTRAPLGRVAVATGVATLAGAALARSGALAVAPRVATALRAVGVLASVLAGFVAVGLPGRLLAPRRWDELAEGLDRGVAALRTATWPYAGGEEWLRVTVLLAVPLVVSLAAAVLFWPGERRRGARSAAALAALLVLYGIAVTEHAFPGELGRGVVLLALVLAWLWPGTPRSGEGFARAGVVVAVGLVALLVAGRLEDRRAVVDYQSWQLLGEPEEGSQFNWDHRYGPMTWPRRGTTLLQVRSERPFYWRAQTLDRFDGFRWLYSGGARGAGSELPRRPKGAWWRRMEFTVRSLQSDLVVGAGTPVTVRGVGFAVGSPDGTWTSRGRPLRRGDSYAVIAYVPEPTPAQLRTAGGAYDPRFSRYTTVELPQPGESALIGGAREASPRLATPGTSSQVTYGLFRRGAVNWGDPEQRVARSRYARVQDLAKLLARNQTSAHGVVLSVQRHLRSGRFTYSERPPQRAVPLADFLLDHRQGYCQQFSGAMALLLRMNGIPARVAAGFSPGLFNERTGEYRVRDLDAHSWVEVYFPRLGWVAFDPTPPAAPAERQVSDEAEEGDGGSTPGNAGSAGVRIPGADRTTGDAGSGELGLEDDGGFRLWWVGAVVVGVAGLGLLGVWIRALVLRRRPAEAAGGDELRELEAALRRLGYDVSEATTLLALERRLGRLAGPAAAGYVRRLRDVRFGPPGARVPADRDRRALRRALTEHRGPLARALGFLVLPPRALSGLPDAGRRARDRGARPTA